MQKFYFVCWAKKLVHRVTASNFIESQKGIKKINNKENK